MAILNLGSINIDHVYSVATLALPGETITAGSLQTGLGGKGANQSIAAARAGATVRHIGAIGSDADWTLASLNAAGVDTKLVAQVDVPTGHAMITVDAAGENSIVLFKGANHAITKAQIDTALQTARTGDWLLLQNETNLSAYAAQQARHGGLKVAYCAAPFDPEAVREMLPYTDLLSVNEIEARQIRQSLPDKAKELDRVTWLTTLGADGAAYDSAEKSVKVAAYRVEPVDTTGAGDTFLGYALAGVDTGMPVEAALKRASAAAAIQVTRKGAATAIPKLSEVMAFMESSDI